MVTVSADGIFHSNAGILRSSTKKPTTEVTDSRRVAFYPSSSCMSTGGGLSTITTNPRKVAAPDESPSRHGYVLHAFDDKIYSGNEQPRSSIGGHFVDLDESEETGTSGTDEQSTESSNISVNITDECTTSMQQAPDKQVHSPDKGRETTRNFVVGEFKKFSDCKTQEAEQSIAVRPVFSDTVVSHGACKKVAQRCLFNENRNEAQSRHDSSEKPLLATKSDSALQEMQDRFCRLGKLFVYSLLHNNLQYQVSNLSRRGNDKSFLYI